MHSRLTLWGYEYRYKAVCNWFQRHRQRERCLQVCFCVIFWRYIRGRRLPYRVVQQHTEWSCGSGTPLQLSWPFQHSPRGQVRLVCRYFRQFFSQFKGTQFTVPWGLKANFSKFPSWSEEAVCWSSSCTGLHRCNWQETLFWCRIFPPKVWPTGNAGMGVFRRGICLVLLLVHLPFFLFGFSHWHWTSISL